MKQTFTVIGLLLGVAVLFVLYAPWPTTAPVTEYQSPPGETVPPVVLPPTTTRPVPQPVPLPPKPVACTKDAKQCPDGSFVGRTGPDCSFAPCPLSTDSDEQKSEQYCDQENRPEFCTEIYQPVCAAVAVECVTTPCPPVRQTFSNGCHACANDRVVSYLSNACAG